MSIFDVNDPTFLGAGCGILTCDRLITISRSDTSENIQTLSPRFRYLIHYLPQLLFPKL